MKTFLIVVAGVVVGLLLVVALGWFWLKRKLKTVCEAIGHLAKGGIPPFRVTLERGEPEWSHPEAVETATRNFAGAGYQAVGDYTVEEMPDFGLRSLWHPESGSYGVLYDHPEVGTYADLFQNLADGTHVTITCAPETGMDRPPQHVFERLELDVDDYTTAAQLHDRLVSASRGRQPVRGVPEDFVDTFSEAYAQEMDWRIARGGVTEAEIRRVAELGGDAEPDEATVEMIQCMWRGMIEGFVDEQALENFLADSAMTAREWERRRDNVAVVHEHSDRESKLDELAWRMIVGTYPEDDEAAEDAALERARAQLKPLLEGGSLRAGFASAMERLPEKYRYEKLGSVEDPWPADVYLIPENHDGGL